MAATYTCQMTDCTIAKVLSLIYKRKYGINIRQPNLDIDERLLDDDLSTVVLEYKYGLQPTIIFFPHITSHPLNFLTSS